MSCVLSHRPPLFSNLLSELRRKASRAENNRAVTKPPCPELSRLPKANRLTSLRFKRTLPGRSGHLAYGPFTMSHPSLDPSHPLTSFTPQQLLRAVPHYRCSLFTLHCYPFAVLKKFDYPEYMLLYKQKGSTNQLHQLMSRMDPRLKLPPPAHIFPNDVRREKKSLSMPLMVLIPKHIHKSGFVRTKLKQRLKEALKLVVIRGAVPSGSGNGVSFLSTERSPTVPLHEQLIIKDCVYSFRPTIKIKLAPWPTLLKEIRQALDIVKRFEYTTHRKFQREPTEKSSRYMAHR